MLGPISTGWHGLSYPNRSLAHFLLCFLATPLRRNLTPRLFQSLTTWQDKFRPGMTLPVALAHFPHVLWQAQSFCARLRMCRFVHVSISIAHERML